MTYAKVRGDIAQPRAGPHTVGNDVALVGRESVRTKDSKTPRPAGSLRGVFDDQTMAM